MVCWSIFKYIGKWYSEEFNIKISYSERNNECIGWWMKLFFYCDKVDYKIIFYKF